MHDIDKGYILIKLYIAFIEFGMSKCYAMQKQLIRKI